MQLLTERMILFSFTIFAFMVLGLCPALHAGEKRMVSISGSVQENGEPVEGVIITIYGSGVPAPVVTNQYGYYTFEIAAGSSFGVAPSRSGYTFNPSNRSYQNVQYHYAGQDYVSNSTFQLKVSLNGIKASSLAWGDYDNDGDKDLALCGTSSAGDSLTRLYRNDGNNGFVEVNDSFPDSDGGPLGWADMDKDGDLDLVLSSSFGTSIYRNDGNGNFVDMNVNLPGLLDWGNFSLGDYDNDGDLDIALTGIWVGQFSKIYRNDGNGIFTDINAALPQMLLGFSVEWGDYDNDGDLDLVYAGHSQGGPLTRILRNNGNDNFTPVNAGLIGLSNADAAWGDYDNDGDLDLALCGTLSSGGTEVPTTRIYRNHRNGNFVDINAGVPGIAYGQLAWGDYDNDGDLDLAVLGSLTPSKDRSVTRVYRNNGNHTFSEIGAGLAGLNQGALAWGDYNGDSSLDMVISGQNNAGYYFTKVYQNNSTVTNTRPTTPMTVSSQVIPAQEAVILSWKDASDAQTSPAGLSYNLCVGTASNTCDIVSPMTLIQGSPFSMDRLIPARGSIQKRVFLGAIIEGSGLRDDVALTNNWRLEHLAPGTYYWHVQAIDSGFMGSQFVYPQSFTMPAKGKQRK